MAKITKKQMILLRLIERSPDAGDGWRHVSDGLWRHVEEQRHKKLTEIDKNLKRIRFTPDGLVVMKYLS